MTCADLILNCLVSFNMFDTIPLNDINSQARKNMFIFSKSTFLLLKQSKTFIRYQSLTVISCTSTTKLDHENRPKNGAKQRVDIFIFLINFKNNFMGEKRTRQAERSQKSGPGNECAIFFFFFLDFPRLHQN